MTEYKVTRKAAKFPSTEAMKTMLSAHTVSHVLSMKNCHRRDKLTMKRFTDWI